MQCTVLRLYLNGSRIILDSFLGLRMDQREPAGTKEEENSVWISLRMPANELVCHININTFKGEAGEDEVEDNESHIAERPTKAFRRHRNGRFI